MSPDLTVVHYGTDSSGRGIYMTQWMIDVYEAIKKMPAVAPFAWKLVIVQGAFMTRNGGGASTSAGYHDQAGCLDIRTWNLTTAEVDAFVVASRKAAFAFWRRDLSAARGGMDAHLHGVLGTDKPLASGASSQWQQYLNGRSGLASNGPDYEWRPHPLVTETPNDILQEDYLMSDAAEKKLDQLIALAKDTNSDLATFRTQEQNRDKKARVKAQESKKQLVAAIAGVVDTLVEIDAKVSDDASRKQLNKVKKQLLDALADDPDVDGADAPAPTK